MYSLVIQKIQILIIRVLFPNPLFVVTLQPDKLIILVYDLLWYRVIHSPILILLL
ncbi:unnamed protein product [Trichobilharzia regenti]|nr:unnamed protein product [Trichobilharzia regenti]